MLFKGTPSRRPIDITRAIEGRGGNFNACTGEESTCYYAHMPYEYLNEAMDILFDMYLNATIPDEEFEREKQVVLEEIKMYADEPDAVAMENLQRALFPKNRLGAPVAGSAKSLVPLTSADLRRYIETHYAPSRTVAVVVGRFDEESALKEISRRISQCRRKASGFKNVGKVDFSVSPIAETSASRDIQQTQIALGFRTFGINDERKYAASVLDAVLGKGMSSRLFQEVREKRGLSYDISSRMQFFSDAGMFTVTAGVDPEKEDLAIKTIGREIDKIRSKKVSEAELRRIKEFMLGNFRLSHERVVSKLFFYGSTLLSYGRLMTTDEQVEAVKSVTSDDVLSVAREIFDSANGSYSRVVPKISNVG
jgi:predicted Zn-dependent peptidase